jgi:hypothetical protein
VCSPRWLPARTGEFVLLCFSHGTFTLTYLTYVERVTCIAVVVYFCHVLSVLVFIALHMYVASLLCVNIGIAD